MTSSSTSIGNTSIGNRSMIDFTPGQSIADMMHLLTYKCVNYGHLYILRCRAYRYYARKLLRVISSQIPIADIAAKIYKDDGKNIDEIAEEVSVFVKKIICNENVVIAEAIKDTVRGKKYKSVNEICMDIGHMLYMCEWYCLHDIDCIYTKTHLLPYSGTNSESYITIADQQSRIAYDCLYRIIKAAHSVAKISIHKKLINTVCIALKTEVYVDFGDKFATDMTF